MKALRPTHPAQTTCAVWVLHNVLSAQKLNPFVIFKRWKRSGVRVCARVCVLKALMHWITPFYLARLPADLKTPSASLLLNLTLFCPPSLPSSHPSSLPPSLPLFRLIKSHNMVFSAETAGELQSYVDFKPFADSSWRAGATLEIGVLTVCRQNSAKC